MSEGKEIVLSGLLERSRFEEMLYDISEDNIEFIKKRIFIYNSDDNQKWLLDTLFQLASVRYEQWKLIAELLVLIDMRNTPFRLVFHKYNPFACYLFLRGIINESDFEGGVPGEKELEMITEDGILLKKGTIAYFIKDDDYDGLKSILPSDFDVNSKVDIVYGGHVFPRMIDFACYMASFSVFGGLIKDGSDLTDLSINFLVRSGDKSFLKLLSRLDITFENQLENAVAVHNNSVAHWLMRHFDQSSFKLPNLPSLRKYGISGHSN